VLSSGHARLRFTFDLLFFAVLLDVPPRMLMLLFSQLPQSYTGYEPTSMRAIRARYDPYVQVCVCVCVCVCV